MIHCCFCYDLFIHRSKQYTKQTPHRVKWYTFFLVDLTKKQRWTEHWLGIRVCRQKRTWLEFFVPVFRSISNLTGLNMYPPTLGLWQRDYALTIKQSTRGDDRGSPFQQTSVLCFFLTLDFSLAITLHTSCSRIKLPRLSLTRLVASLKRYKGTV